MFTEKQLEKIKEQSLAVREDLSSLSATVREQAKEIRQIGRKIDNIFSKVEEVNLLPGKVDKESFVELLNALKEINKAAQKLKRKAEDD